MSRLIEVQLLGDYHAPLTVRVGDVLLVRATGGRVRDGSSAVELWGSYLPAVIDDTGAVVSPMGAPNALLVRACQPGSASLDLFSGDPWHTPRTTTLNISVEL